MAQLDDKFTREVCEQIKCYVYRLIDPRNGQTFYVGKGQGNRVFDHVNAALKLKESTQGEDEENKDTFDNTKMQTILDIRHSGLNVMHVIHRYGLTNEEAIEVESALMDAYPGLTNIQRGHGYERGVTNTKLIQEKYSYEQFKDRDDIKYMLIKVKWDVVNDRTPYSKGKDEGIYEATRYSWRIRKNRADKCDYVLSVIDGVVEGVYKVKEWKLVEESNRYEFFRDDNPDKEIVNYFLKKRIPDKYTKKGMANPVLYSFD